MIDRDMAAPRRILRGLAKNDLLRGSGASLVIRLLDRGIAYVMIALLAIYLKLDAFGEYSFYISIVTMMMIPSSFGLPALLVRETGKAIAVGDRGRILALKSWAYRQALRCAVPIFVFGLVAAIALPDRVLSGPERLTAALALLLLGVVPFSTIRAAILRGMNNIVGSQVTLQIVRPLVQSIVIGLLILAGWIGWNGVPANASTAMAANVLGGCVSWVVGYMLLARYLQADRSPKPYGKLVIEGWKGSLLALGLTDAMAVIDSQLGLFLLGLLGTNADVGLFRIAAQGAMVVSMGYVATNVAVTPKIATHWATGDVRTVRRVVARGAQMAMAFGTPMALFLVLFGEFALRLLFGAQFTAAALPLAILTFGQLVDCAFGSSTALLNMTGHEKLNACSFAASLSLNAALSMLLIPRLGIEGAAIASCLSIIVRNLFVWLAARRLLGIDTGFWSRG